MSPNSISIKDVKITRLQGRPRYHLPQPYLHRQAAWIGPRRLYPHPHCRLRRLRRPIPPRSLVLHQCIWVHTVLVSVHVGRNLAALGHPPRRLPQSLLRAQEDQEDHASSSSAPGRSSLHQQIGKCLSRSEYGSEWSESDQPDTADHPRHFKFRR